MMMTMAMTPLNPWLGIAGVLASLAAMLVALDWWQRRANPQPELARKLAHVGMGAVTLCFGWLFDRPWPVWTLCAGAGLLLAASRWWGPMRQRMGSALGGVGRGGGGEFYFAFSVALIFWLSRNTNFARGTNLLYIIPVLILTLADALGALVGVNYGRARYVTDDGHKSAEGSLAFFLAAFFSTHVPLLLYSDTGRAESLLIGLTLGLLVMLLEAVCWGGLDNLFVPLASFVALRIYLHQDAQGLALRLAILIGLTGFMFSWRRRTHLTDSAPLAGALVLYFSWALGGWPWLVGPAALLAGYTLLCPGALKKQPRPTVHNVAAVVCVSSAGLGWLFAAAAGGYGAALLFPFTLSFAAHLGMMALAHFRCGNRRPAGWRTVAQSLMVGAGLVMLPYAAFCARPAAMAAWQLALGLAAVGGAVAMFGAWQKGMDDCPTNASRWIRQGALAAIASLGGFAAAAG
jgi:phytol kinase